MNWKKGKPPDDFVGFAIEYKEPGGDQFFALKNRLCFPGRGRQRQSEHAVHDAVADPEVPLGSLPAQRRARLATSSTASRPVFMNAKGELSYGEPQEVAIELRRETYPGEAERRLHARLRVVAGVRRQVRSRTSIPHAPARQGGCGLDFVPTHPKADEALAWMGFEARSAILEVLDEAIADTSAAGARRRLRPERARHRVAL